MHGITNECTHVMLVLQLPLMTMKHLINIAAQRHFRHMTTQESVQLGGGGWLPDHRPGAQPPDPPYSFALRARHMSPNPYSWIRPGRSVICSPDNRNVGALEVLHNRALQIDIYLLTYLLHKIC